MSPSSGNADTYQAPKMVRITQPMLFQPQNSPKSDQSAPKMIHHQSLQTKDVNTGFVISSPFKGTQFGDGKNQFQPFERHERGRSTTTVGPTTPSTTTTPVPVYIGSTKSSGYVEPQESRNLPSGTRMYREALNDRETYGSPTPLITVHDLKTADPYSAKEQEHKHFLDQAENDIISGKGRPHLEFPPAPTKEPQYVPNYFKDLPDYEDEESDEINEGQNEGGRFRTDPDYDQSPKDAFGDFKFEDSRPTQEQPQDFGDFTQFGPTQYEDESDIGPLNFHAATEKPFGVGEPDFMDYDEKDSQNQKHPAGTQPSSHANHLFGDVFPDFSDDGPLTPPKESDIGNQDYGGDYRVNNDVKNQYDSDYPEKFLGDIKSTSPPHPTSIAAILSNQNRIPPFTQSIIQGPGPAHGFPGNPHLGPKDLLEPQGKGKPSEVEGGNFEEPDPNAGFDEGDYYEKQHDAAAEEYEDNFDYDTLQVTAPGANPGFKQGRLPGQFRGFQRGRRRRPFHPRPFKRLPIEGIQNFNNPLNGNKFRSVPLFDVTQQGFGNIKPNPAYPDPLPVSLPVEHLPQAIREQLNSGQGPQWHQPQSGHGLNSDDYAHEEGQGNINNNGFSGTGDDLTSNDISLYGLEFDESLLDNPKLYNNPNDYQPQEGLGPQFRSIPNLTPPQHPAGHLKGRFIGKKVRRPIIVRQAHLRLRQRLRGPHQNHFPRPRAPLPNVPNYDYHDGQVEGQNEFDDDYSDYTEGPEFRDLKNLGPSADEFDLPEAGFADLSAFEDEDDTADQPKQPSPAPQAREVPQFPVPDRPNLLTHWIAGTPTHILIKEGNEHKLKKIKWKKHPLPVFHHGPPLYVPSETLPRGIKIAPHQVQKQ